MAASASPPAAGTPDCVPRYRSAFIEPEAALRVPAFLPAALLLVACSDPTENGGTVRYELESMYNQRPPVVFGLHERSTPTSSVSIRSTR